MAKLNKPEIQEQKEKRVSNIRKQRLIVSKHRSYARAEDKNPLHAFIKEKYQTSPEDIKAHLLCFISVQDVLLWMSEKADSLLYTQEMPRLYRLLDGLSLYRFNKSMQCWEPEEKKEELKKDFNTHNISSFIFYGFPVTGIAGALKDSPEKMFHWLFKWIMGHDATPDDLPNYIRTAETEMDIAQPKIQDPETPAKEQAVSIVNNETHFHINTVIENHTLVQNHTAFVNTHEPEIQEHVSQAPAANMGTVSKTDRDDGLTSHMLSTIHNFINSMRKTIKRLKLEEIDGINHTPSTKKDCLLLVRILANRLGAKRIKYARKKRQKEFSCGHCLEDLSGVSENPAREILKSAYNLFPKIPNNFREILS